MGRDFFSLLPQEQETFLLNQTTPTNYPTSPLAENVVPDAPRFEYTEQTLEVENHLTRFRAKGGRRNRAADHKQTIERQRNTDMLRVAAKTKPINNSRPTRKPNTVVKDMKLLQRIAASPLPKRLCGSATISKIASHMNLIIYT